MLSLKKFSHYFYQTRLLPVGIPVLLGLLITVLTANYLHQADKNSYERKFDGQVHSLHQIFTEEFDDHQEIVQMLASHYTASQSKGRERDDFSRFVAWTIANHNGVQALEWIPRVKQSERASYEQAMRDNGFKDFQFKQWTPEQSTKWTASKEQWADEYFPVYFMQPHQQNKGAFGIDLASNPVRRKALEQSRDSGQRAVTERITLAQGGTKQAGFLIFVPVYTAGQPTGTVAQRRRHLQGFALGVCRIGSIVEQVLKKQSVDGIELQIIDDSAQGKQQFLYTTSQFTQNQNHRQKTTLDYQLAGRRWKFQFVPTEEYYQAHYKSRAWLVIVGGGLITGLIGLILNTLLSRAQEIEHVVLQRTEELLQSQQQLEVAQVELQEKARIAEAATIAKSEFLANMSHEIRTPMTAIIGFTEILLSDETQMTSPKQRTESLQTIQQNGYYLLELINNILDISKIEAGKLDVETISCSLIKTLADIDSLMRVRAKAKGIDLGIEFTGAIPASIQTDPTRLRQILINLIGNAIKFTEVGSVRVVVRMLNETSACSTMQLEVIDTGVGLTAPQMASLFQPFMQADNSTTRKFGGTGLGLTISKRLAERMGGNITVQSEFGKGSQFILEIQTGSLEKIEMITAPSLVQHNPQNNSSNTTASKQKPLDCRILLAEDGLDNQRLISFILKKAGADVTVAENGLIAYNLALEAEAEERPFNVILMDMQMPVMDGYMATQKLRKNDYPRPIIALTAHAMSGDRKKCLAAGCNEYTTKPIDRKKLISLVAEWSNVPKVDIATATAELPE